MLISLLSHFNELTDISTKDIYFLYFIHFLYFRSRYLLHLHFGQICIGLERNHLILDKTCTIKRDKYTGEKFRNDWGIVGRCAGKINIFENDKSRNLHKLKKKWSSSWICWICKPEADLDDWLISSLIDEQLIITNSEKSENVVLFVRN